MTDGVLAELLAPHMTKEDWDKVRRSVNGNHCELSTGHWCSEDLAAHLLVHLDIVARGLTAHQRAMTTHALALDAGGHRNYYVCENDFTTLGHREWTALVSAGLAERGRNINENRDAVFRVSEPWGRVVAERARELGADYG